MKKLAIVVIHGVGRHEKHQPEQNTDRRTFSAPLHDALTLRLGESVMRDRIAWREVFWADLLQERQDQLEARMSRVLSVKMLRKLVLSVLGDAANYTYSPGAESTYQKIHARVAQVLDQLEADTDGGPVLFVAHSLGGHILSNFMWDRSHQTPPAETPFQRLETFAGLQTFGCNIPVFIFQHQTVSPFTPPDASADSRVSPWWRNFYGPKDPLGYPLAPSGDGYAVLAEGPDPQLIDRAVRPGIPFLQSHTFLSHTAYWKSRTIHSPLEEMVREAFDKTGDPLP